MPMTPLFGRLLAVTLLFGVTTLSAFADTVYSTYPVTGKSGANYEISADGGYSGEHEIAMQFTLPTTSQVASATLALYFDPTLINPAGSFTGGPIDVKIYDDDTGRPNTVLTTGTIASISTSGSIDDYTVTFSSPVTLTAGADYWISAVGENGNATTAFWAYGTGFGNFANRYDASFNTGFTLGNDTPGAFSIQSTPSASTPEPGITTAMLSLGIIGMGVWRRRRPLHTRSAN